MASAIDRDVERAREIIRGRVRKELREYINRGEMIGRRGKDLVSIPVPDIDIPNFRFGKNRRGVAQGDGEPGDPIGEGADDDGKGQAGSEPGEHITEEFSVEELARMMGEELELPNLQPKGRQQLTAEGHRYTGVHLVGPKCLRIGRRTLKEAILRSMLSIFPPELALQPDFIPADHITIIPPDERYRMPQPIVREQFTAVIVYIMDVSGSMMDEMKEMVRMMCRWIEIWINGAYKGVEKRYIIHDAVAREVNEDRFYHTRESGGTVISSAYRLAAALLDPKSGYQSSHGGSYDPNEWNVYVFQFSDGDNWGEDNRIAEAALREILPQINLLGYAQVESPYGSGEFIKIMKKLSVDHPNLVYTAVEDRDGIYDGICALLGRKSEGVKK